MSPAASLLAIAWALGAPQAVRGPEPPAPAPARERSARVVEHTLRPLRPEAGASADELLVVWAPEGTEVRVADAGAPGGSVERTGSWWASREPEAGGVRWTFSAPLAAWEEGARTGPSLSVSYAQRGRGEERAVPVEGIAFVASSPLGPLDQGGVPAPPEGPLEAPPRGWRSLLSLVLAAGAVGAGARALVLRREARAGGRERAADADAPPARGETLEEALASTSSPAQAAVRVAEALRAHTRLRDSGVTRAHTTAEVSERVPAADVTEALALADAVKYGGHMPSPEQVLAAGRKAARALEEGSRD